MTTPTPPPTLHSYLAEAVWLAEGIDANAICISSAEHGFVLSIHCSSYAQARAAGDAIDAQAATAWESGRRQSARAVIVHHGEIAGSQHRVVDIYEAVDEIPTDEIPTDEIPTDEIPTDVQDRLVATTRAAAEGVARAEAGS